MTKALSSGRAGRWAAAVVSLLLIVAAHGAAQAAKRRAGVSLTGPHASSVREGVAVALKHHGFVTTSTDVASDSQSAIAAAAKDGKLAAVILGEVRDGGKRLKLRVYGAGGDLIGEGSWSEAAGIKKLVKVLEHTLWARVGGSLSKARAASGGKGDKPEKADEDQGDDKGDDKDEAASDEDKPTSSRSKDSDALPAAEENEPARKHGKKKPAEADEPEETPSGAAGTALDFAVGPRFMSRSLVWKPQVMGLRGYSLGLAPGIGALFAWYPAAHVRGGWISNVGLAGSLELTPGLVSQTGDGSRFPTSEADVWVGLRGRLIFGAMQGSLTLAGGQHGFIFHSQAGANRDDLADLPDVKYTYARAALDLRIALPANLSLMVGGGYRYVLGGGDQNYLIQAPAYFPNAKFVAFDVTAAVGYKFLSMLEARAGFDLRRYQMTPGAPGMTDYMVTGATDQYVGLWLQLAILLDGYAAGEGGASAPHKGATSTHSDDEGTPDAPDKTKKKKGGDDDE